MIARLPESAEMEILRRLMSEVEVVAIEFFGKLSERER